MKRGIALVFGAMVVAIGLPAQAAEIKVLSFLSSRPVLEQARPAFEQATGHKLVIVYGSVEPQRDRVVASYSVLSAVGGLSPQVLGLKVQVYDPTVHYQQVRDAWGGVRTPDGR